MPESENNTVSVVTGNDHLFFKDLMLNLPAAVVVHSSDTSITYCNPVATTLLGLSEDQLMGRKAIDPGWSFIREDGTKTPFEAYPVNRVLSSGKAVRNLVAGINRPSASDQVWVMVNAFPLLDVSGRVSRVVVAFTDITLLKKAETIIRTSEHELRTLFDGIAAGIGIVVDRKFIKINRGLCIITGYTEAELVDEPVTKLYADEQEFIRAGAELYNPDNRKNIVEVETKCRRKDGEIRNVLIYSSFIDSTEPSKGIIATILDITERKQAEDALRRSEEEFKSLFEASSAGAAILADRLFKRVNSVLLRITGFTSDELIGKPTRVLYADDAEFERVGRELYPQIRDEGFGMMEARIMHKTGYMIDVVICGSPLDINDFAKGVSVTILDISQRKRAEEALKQSEAEFKSLFEATPAGAVMLVDRVFKRVSSKLTRMLGYTEEEMVNHSARMIYDSDEEFERAGSELYGSMEHDGLGKTEARIRRKDGSMIDVQLYVSPLDPMDFSKGVSATVEDVTERKKAEADKEKLQEQLNQSQKMESIGRLAGGVAHDFNNMLTAIIGNTELAMLKLDRKEQIYSRLSVVKQAAESAADLTKQLLAFSRKQIINPTVINLNDIIDTMQSMLIRLIGENITLRVILHPGLYPVKIDASQIQQIIMNLTINARDAMPDGGTLIIETGNTMLDDDYCRRHDYPISSEHVMLVVSDTGMGLSDEVKEHLFEPFFTTKAQGKGTGLGLATVYGAVRQNGGTIDVYSEEGQGTSFKIYFPISIEDISTLPQQWKNDNMPEGNETILLVEDNPLVLDFSRGILEMLGYRVLTAATGEEAITAAKNCPDLIHLLMTDVVLPGINGHALAEKMQVQKPGIKVLFNSGYTQEAIVTKGVLKQGLHFISKPFSALSIAQKIREVLDEKLL